MTTDDLKVIYDRDVMYAGDTEHDFYEWAIKYLIEIYTKEKIRIQIIKRHAKGIQEAIRRE